MVALQMEERAFDYKRPCNVPKLEAISGHEIRLGNYISKF